MELDLGVCHAQHNEMTLTRPGSGSGSPNTWNSFVGSDFAENSEVQKQAQVTYGDHCFAEQLPSTVFWSSKVSSVAFADEDIGEAHADTSNGAAAMYAAGNYTHDFMFLSHVADEMNLECQRPFKIQMDNAAAECFALGTAFKSKLKHNDCRQEWVRVLRNRGISSPTFFIRELRTI